MIDIENKRYYPQPDKEISQKYGTLIWGKFEASSPREVSCQNGIKPIVIKRTIFDFIVHYLVGGIYTARSIEAECNKEESFEIGKSLTENKKLSLNSIYFNLNSAEILSESYPILNQVANALKKENFTKLTLLGHTDLTGNSENNLILSQRRAESVKKYLIEKGVAQNKIFAKGLGSTKPLVNLSDEEASKKNRRIEFVLE